MIIENQIFNDAMAKRISAEGFIYRVQIQNPGVVGSVTQFNVQIQNDSDFLWVATALVSYNAGAIVANPDYLLTVLDTGTGRQLQDGPIHVANCTGTAQWPFKLPEPKLCRGGGTLNFQLTDTSGAADLVDIALHGYKVYKLAGFTR